MNGKGKSRVAKTPCLRPSKRSAIHPPLPKEKKKIGSVLPRKRRRSTRSRQEFTSSPGKKKRTPVSAGRLVRKPANKLSRKKKKSSCLGGGVCTGGEKKGGGGGGKKRSPFHERVALRWGANVVVPEKRGRSKCPGKRKSVFRAGKGMVPHCRR